MGSSTKLNDSRLRPGPNDSGLVRDVKSDRSANLLMQ